VEPEKTYLFLDIPHKLHAWLVPYFGPVGAGIVAALIFLILFVIFIGWVVIRPTPTP
jgi:hypothetical protein